ncbi:MAG: IMP cyclohydrolase [Lentisphaerae bacterium GWF2_44_16]|nr:MAG: IMP cyclohydrolase [Lentisphaerae bacterium GWF2_44_16]
MVSKKLDKKSYHSKNTGDFPDNILVGANKYVKVNDLRYGTNPHQPAAYYKPANKSCPIADMELLKTAKNGLSQTNLEDISYSLNIVKYFDSPACAVMKHVNPCGVAVMRGDETLRNVYKKARDCDARAAFGSVVAFNIEVDRETAEELMSTFIECVVAPSFSEEALAVFNDEEKFKLCKNLRVVKCGDISELSCFVGEEKSNEFTMKVLADGSMVMAAPLLTQMKSIKDMKPASAESKTLGKVDSKIKADRKQMEDLVAAWYINLNVRSNGVVIFKNGQTLAVGTGEQDRVGAVEQAIEKYKTKYKGVETIKGAVMSSDGFFPFPDAVEVAAKAGITAVIAPSGSLRDADVIKRANELGVALFHSPERIFSHH